MGRTRCEYNWKDSGRQVFFDDVTHETIHGMFPIHFYDDFLGYKFNKYIANENTVAPWTTVVTDMNLAPLLVANEPNGVVQITLDVDDITQQGVIYWGDQLSLDISKGLIFEFRATFNVLALTGTETVQAVMGVASATGATLDNIATNAWFKVESAANTVLLYESDDGDDDDNDNAAGITLVADTYHIFRIDFTDVTNVRFYVDGALVGTTSMATLSAAEAKVQPYFCMSKTKSAANTGTGTIYLDYVKIWQNRE